MKVYCRVVNKALAGEPSHRVFQVQDTLEIIEYDDVTHTLQNDIQRESDILNDVEYVLKHMGHYCEIIYNDNGYHRHTLILE
jgi:glutamine synthetase type III